MKTTLTVMLAALVLAAIPGARSAPINASALVTAIDNLDGTFDYTFTFDQASGRLSSNEGLVFEGLGLSLLVRPLTDGIYNCCSLVTENAVQNNLLAHGGLGAATPGMTDDGIGYNPGAYHQEGLMFSLTGASDARLMDFTLNGGTTDAAFGGVGVQYSVNLASRHYAYGSLLTNRTSWVASDWDGVGTESSYRGNLDMPGDFLITPSISSAASNHICGSDPFNEACQFFDGYVETMTFRTSIAPTYTVPAPAGLLSLALGLTGLVTGQWRRQHHA